MAASSSHRNSEGKPVIREGVWGSRRARFRGDRVVLKLAAPTATEQRSPEQRLQAILDTMPGAGCLRGPGRTGRALLAVPTDTDILAVAKRLSARDDVEYAEPDIVDAGTDPD